LMQICFRFVSLYSPLGSVLLVISTLLFRHLNNIAINLLLFMIPAAVRKSIMKIYEEIFSITLVRLFFERMHE